MKGYEKKLVEIIQVRLSPEESNHALRHLEQCPVCRERGSSALLSAKKQKMTVPNLKSPPY